ncbi:hypothetical protein BamMC406_2983 [Burkholderia ambifaria MC40-6]|uniref:Uncharacterized protein n=1 Tax=Burkholderia ambifaria (strain MC40-6) TaxID=398577 RepID=B1YPP5_BURA4|nr:hypothetical protein BamMC406_2983 [Burkholderia ambifaria MC40-6]
MFSAGRHASRVARIAQNFSIIRITAAKRLP